jgi:hypothetical protein
VRLLGLGLSHHSFNTSSEEPPLSIFNSYWDIPIPNQGELFSNLLERRDVDSKTIR